MKKIFRKLAICFAAFTMMFTSVFTNITPIFAAGETTFFEVNKADEVINEAKNILENLMYGEQVDRTVLIVPVLSVMY